MKLKMAIVTLTIVILGSNACSEFSSLKSSTSSLGSTADEQNNSNNEPVVGSNPAPTPNPTPNPAPSPMSNPAPTPSPLPVTGAGAWPNEPVNSRLINDTPMNSLSENGWNDVYKGYSSDIFQDPTAPVSPSGVLRQKIPTGLPGGDGGGGGSFLGFPSPYNNLKEVYHAYYIKTDAQYENHPILTKISWIHSQDTAGEKCVTDNQFFLALVGPGPFSISANYQNTCINNPDYGGFGTIQIYSSAGQIIPGKWALIEQYLKISTTNTSRDGVWRVYLDGKLIINADKLNTGRAAFYGVSHITIWGGTGSVKSRDSFLYFDHEHVSAPNR